MVLSWPLAYRGSGWLADLSPGFFWQLPPIFLFLYAFLTSLLCLVVGNGLLKGRNWSRVLAVAYCFAAIVISFVLYERTPLFWVSLIFNLAFTMIMWFFLFRPESNAFFAEAEGLGRQRPVV